MRMRFLAIMAVSGLWVGCGGEADKALNDYKKASLASQADVTKWAGSASAPNVYTAANLGAILSGVAGIGGGEQDSTCPVTKKNGTTTTVTGGCTDSEGNEWLGSMEQKRESESSDNGTITYKDFGYQQAVSCSGKSGKAKLLFTGTMTTKGSDAKQEFDIDVRLAASGLDEDTCTDRSTSAAWSYKGTQEGTANIEGRRTWNGSGRIGTLEDGLVEVETKAEVIDLSVCSDEALSGTTTIKSGSNTAVVTYDGATDCDEASTVKTSLNGGSAVEISGISCSSAGGPALSAWSLGLMGSLALLRRRSRR